MINRSINYPVAFVIVLALAANLGLGFKLGMTRQMESDSFYYLHIARCVAEGQGFCLREGFWPDTPTMGRAPGWPLVVASVLKICGGVQPDLAMRVLCLTLNSLVAVLVALLTSALFRKPLLTFVAGTAYVLHPTALYLAYTGESEILFLVLAVGGTILLLKDWQLSGFLVFGLACLVRSNFVLWIGFFALLWLACRMWNGMVKSGIPGGDLVLPEGNCSRAPFPFLRLALCFLLFAAPSFVWALRNYRVCGHFPVLNTVRGQTFYGGNNCVVADNPKFWGYWIFPDAIPGETTMRELSKTKSEYEVDRLYFSKGLDFVKGNLPAMPGLCLGKLVRAYLPVPWTRNMGTITVSAFRWIMYVSCFAGIFMLWKQTDLRYKVIFAAMVLANIATVLVFWGCARFAFEIEPFLLPFAAGVIVNGWGKTARQPVHCRPCEGG